MKVSGFSFIRNAVRFDYPVLEAIQSVLPLCDEFIIAVGASDDGTRERIESIQSPKLRILDTTWNESLREGGKVLAHETNKALEATAEDSDWCLYIQGDEVLHEMYHSPLRAAMEKWKDHPEVEGLLFDYLHFYGSYDYVGDSTRWYRKEVRVVRKNPSVYSFRDAQGFRFNNRPLRVKPANAVMFHYGWVKPPEAQQEKQKAFHKLWHGDDWVERHVGDAHTFDYSEIDSLVRFSGTHPSVMQPRIREKNWTFDFDPSKKKLSYKSRLKLQVEKWTGWRPGEYKNYRLLK